jgi:2-keto-4-pentenoate hydratase/2-oxohepta-3-ene-1,7-dioic acid hydratase in catechol pathway
VELSLNKTKFTARRIFCVGMNYSDHIKELNSKMPQKPVIFMKPPTSLVPLGNKIKFPEHGSELHFETEIVLLIGKEGNVKSQEEALSFISGISLGFDLTLRDLQTQIKKDGHPWEICKSFDDSAPIGEFIPITPAMEIHSIEFSGKVNGQTRQTGNSSQMIFSPEKIIHYIGSIWKLLPGDLIYTGTPPGVGLLKKADQISAHSHIFKHEFEWEFQQ